LMEQLFDYEINMNDHLPSYGEDDTDKNDTDNHNINVSKKILKVGELFNNWDEVQVMVNSFAKQNGFMANKSHKDLDPLDKSIVHRHTYNCWKAGVHQPKKIEDIVLHHNGSSGKTNCKWEVSFYLGKLMKKICLTKFENKHNHSCDLATIELAPKNLRLPQDILDKIEHYITHSHLDAGQQYDLLVKEFPKYYINKKNLYNAIHKFWDVRIHDESDASMMLSYLLNQRNKDPDYLNVKKKARAKLQGKMIKCFVENFFSMRISYSQQQFETKYHNMLTKYEPCYSYLEKLYHKRTSWARYSVVKVFTAGIESTKHVESINAVIKKYVDRGTLLKKLVNIIKQKLEKEAQYTRIKDYYGSNPSVSLVSTYSTIFKEVKEWDVNYNDIIEQLYDTPQIHLAELMIDIPYDAIKELWEVSYIASDSMPHYIVILNDSTLLFSRGVKSTTSILLHYMNQVRTCDVYTLAIRSQVNKKFQFGTTMSVAKTSIQIAVSESVTEELTGLLMQFIMKHCHDTGLDIKDISSFPNIMLQESFTAKVTKSISTTNEVTESISNLVLASSTITQGI
ncbi:15992_t:CDS:2, partial [Cetraspora pellucida]